MNKRSLFLSLFLAALLGSTLYSLQFTTARAASFAEGKTLVLYDAASGAIPGESLMDFTDFPPGAASPVYSDGVAVMDSTISGMDTFAGWVSGQAITPEFPILDRAAGFQVNFTVQVEGESHDKNHRAGFSVIILDKDARGIELAFWENEIWAQNDDRTGRLFTHGEGVAFATTNGLTEYQVAIVGDTYALTADSELLLSGPVRDYSKFDGFPDPYETPNFLFWGDDTSVAEARIRLGFVSVTGTQPVLPAAASTSTGTGIPQPAASSTTLAGTTPVQSTTPTSTGRGVELCSSGWIFFTLTVVIMSNKIRRRAYKPS